MPANTYRTEKSYSTESSYVSPLSSLISVKKTASASGGLAGEVVKVGEKLEHPILVNPAKNSISPFVFEGKKAGDESRNQPQVRSRNPVLEEVDRKDQNGHHKNECFSVLFTHRHIEIEPCPSSSRFFINEGKNKKKCDEY